MNIENLTEEEQIEYEQIEYEQIEYEQIEYELEYLEFDKHLLFEALAQLRARLDQRRANDAKKNDDFGVDLTVDLD